MTKGRVTVAEKFKKYEWPTLFSDCIAKDDYVWSLCDAVMLRVSYITHRIKDGEPFIDVCTSDYS